MEENIFILGQYAGEEFADLASNNLKEFLKSYSEKGIDLENEEFAEGFFEAFACSFGLKEDLK